MVLGSVTACNDSSDSSNSAPSQGGRAGNGGNASVGSSAGATATGNQAGVPSGTVATEPLHGFIPTTVTVEDAKAAYEAWKAAQLESCGGGVYRVRWENDKSDSTVSEGIGYGMLLSVNYADRPAFDGLWAYYRLAEDSNGLMNWLRYGCDAHRDTKYNQYPDNAATDADLDVAMALIMAHCRWGDASYAAAADKLLNAIRTTETTTLDGRYVLLAGDSSWFGSMQGGCLNPSYSAPGYFRAYASFVSAPPDKAFWNKLADDTYPTLLAGQNPTTGLIRNWTNMTGGTATCASSFTCADQFGDDAIRAPWRIATDYVWWGTPDAKTFLDRITLWTRDTVGIANLKTNYLLDGSPGDCVWHGDRIETVGSFSCAAMAYDVETTNLFAAEIKNTTDPDYYERSLRALYLMLLTGQFTTCGNKP